LLSICLIYIIIYNNNNIYIDNYQLGLAGCTSGGDKSSTNSAFCGNKSYKNAGGPSCKGKDVANSVSVGLRLAAAGSVVGNPGKLAPCTRCNVDDDDIGLPLAPNALARAERAAGDIEP